MLSALSPLDGRYAQVLEPLRPYFCEEALIRARVIVEIRYLSALSKESGVKELKPFSAAQEAALLKIIKGFDAAQAVMVKQMEEKTKHDVKAVEYYLQGKVSKIPGMKDAVTFLHFALTSEDINNLAYGILITDALKAVILPALKKLHEEIVSMAKANMNVTLLSLTHGQPATPTTVGKELQVFAARIEHEMEELEEIRMQGKLSGAVGNFSAHKAAYPNVNWERFRDTFVKSLGFIPLKYSTQINPHDDIAELSNVLQHLNTILIGLCRDSWMYISRGVFRQKVIVSEVGSSTMPHKVNPIDFENAEGNLGLSNALFHHFAEKLPISRLQRDLSDSTVQRNIGCAFGYHFLAVQSLMKGLSKLSVDHDMCKRELQAHPEVAAEAIQTVLRKHNVEGAYEKLKALTRGEKVTSEQLAQFIQGLELPKEEKKRLLHMLNQ